MGHAIPSASEWLYFRLEMETLWSRWKCICSICIPLSWPINTIELHGQFGESRLVLTFTIWNAQASCECVWKYAAKNELVDSLQIANLLLRTFEIDFNS